MGAPSAISHFVLRLRVRQVVRLLTPACLCAAVAIANACLPPLQPPPPNVPAPSPVDRMRAYSESVMQARARDSGYEWRADHFPVLDLHGPYTRPLLPAGADTNDPVAYYRLGDSVKQVKQGLADRAFYWALRLDPTMAEAYYRRWQVLYEGVTYRLFPDSSIRLYRHPSHNDPAAAAVDSLRLSAFMYNPFLDATLDIPLRIQNLR